MKKIAVLCPIHKRPDLVLEQLKNYGEHSNNGCFHILHKSIAGAANFSTEFNEKIRPYGIICNKSRPTGWSTVMAAFLAASEHLSVSDFDYVYIHTDGDLLIKGNLQNYIYEYKLGYSGTCPKPEWKWPHLKKMQDDFRFKRIREQLGINDENILVGRQEGAFFPIELWLKIANTIKNEYDDEFFLKPEDHWPIEEVLIPTLAKHFSNGISHVRNVIYTKELKSYTYLARESDLNVVTIHDINVVRNKSQIKCAGMKWFSPKLHNEARKFIKEGNKR